MPRTIGCLVLVCVLICLSGCKSTPEPANPADSSIESADAPEELARISNGQWPNILIGGESRDVPIMKPARPLTGGFGGPVIVLGIDGADWQVLGPMIRRGDLPNLARIMSAGAYGVLRTDVGFSPISWTTIATGASMDAHGVRDNTPLDPQLSSRLRVPPVWEIALANGRSVGLIQVFFGEGLPLPRGSYSARLKWPENEIQGVDIDPAALARLPSSWRNLNRSDVKAYLAVENTPDLYFAIIDSLDVACHYNFQGFAATRPGNAPAAELRPDLERMDSTIEATARDVDQVLGWVWERMPKDATLFLVSDHGQGHIDLEFSIEPAPGLMEALGIESIEEAGGRIKSDIGRLEISLSYDRIEIPCMTIAGAELPLVIRSGRIEIKPAGRIDPSAFRAWAESVVARIPQDGPAALRADCELQDRMLIIRPADPLRAVLDAKPHEDFSAWERGPRFLANHGAENPGIIVVAGPGVAPGRIIEPARIEDIAPTILYAMGLAPSETMTGEVLTGLYLDEHLRKHPAPGPRGYPRPRTVIPVDMDPDTIQRLKSLGYFN